MAKRDGSTELPWKEEDLREISVVELTPEYYHDAVDCINQAFLIDAFFKHPEYHLRADYDGTFTITARFVYVKSISHASSNRCTPHVCSPLSYIQA